MQYDDPSPRTAQIRQADETEPDLERRCEEAAQLDQDVVVAIREFPSPDYKYLYDRYEISIVQARLIRHGYTVETKIVMDKRCSQLILVVENDTRRHKEVHAEKLN